MRGLRKYLTPFAPDQSGAESVLYELGGIIVILDAGGCAGNICGFDEPRWSARKSAVFSAGLRDMDAVMGRDRLLVRKITDCVSKVDARFAAIIGTPVPAVIGTDLNAVKRMLEAKIDLPVITVATDGMHLADRGEEMAYLALLTELERQGKLEQAKPADRLRDADSGLTEADSRNEPQPAGRRAGVFGVTPLDLPDAGSADVIREALVSEGFDEVVMYGFGATLEDYEGAGQNTVNIAASPAGVSAARFLNRKFGTPYEMRFPGADSYLEGQNIVGSGGYLAEQNITGANGYIERVDVSGADRVLIVTSQILGNSLREKIREEYPAAQVTVASWFSMIPDVKEAEDARLAEEDDFIDLVHESRPDLIIADQVMRRMIPDFAGEFIHLPEFAVSGKRQASR